MPISKEIVGYVARLSRIELSEQELDKLSHQMESILGFIDMLGSAKVTDIEPTSHIFLPMNVLRDDVHRPSLSNDQALANAPEKNEGSFVVPRVIE